MNIGSIVGLGVWCLGFRGISGDYDKDCCNPLPGSRLSTGKLM